MKALPGFANNHQNPRSHKDSISKRCFCSPAPVFHELSCCGMAYKSFKEKKMHFEPTSEIIQDWFSAGAATLHLNKGTKFPLGICISISPNSVSSGRDESYSRGEGSAQLSSPARTRGTKVTANKSNGLEPCGNTNLWNSAPLIPAVNPGSQEHLI